MPAPHTEPAVNGRSAPPGDPGANFDDLLTEAESLRDLLQEAQAKLARLAAGFKHHRKQSRALRAAVASLRSLGP
jgi:hypothetical protein